MYEAPNGHGEDGWVQHTPSATDCQPRLEVIHTWQDDHILCCTVSVSCESDDSDPTLLEMWWVGHTIVAALEYYNSSQRARKVVGCDLLDAFLQIHRMESAPKPGTWHENDIHSIRTPE